MKKETAKKEVIKPNIQIASNNSILYDSKLKRVRRKEPVLSRIRKK